MENFTSMIERLTTTTPTPPAPVNSDIPQFVANLNAGVVVTSATRSGIAAAGPQTASLWHASTKQLRILLSNGRSPPIDEVIDAGLLPLLISKLGLDDQPELQFEAAWCLTNVASGESSHVAALLDAGVVRACVARSAAAARLDANRPPIFTSPPPPQLGGRQQQRARASVRVVAAASPTWLLSKFFKLLSKKSQLMCTLSFGR
jgi:hypothetical protein